jgi:hypothetical protein
MKLKKVTKNDPIERLAVSIHQSTMDMLARYQAHYKATYGEEIERSHLVEEMLRDYMESDKDFVKWQSSQPAAKPARGAADSQPRPSFTGLDELPDA